MPACKQGWQGSSPDSTTRTSALPKKNTVIAARPNISQFERSNALIYVEGGKLKKNDYLTKLVRFYDN